MSSFINTLMGHDTPNIYMELHSFCCHHSGTMFHPRKYNFLLQRNKGYTPSGWIYLSFRQKSPLVFELTPPVRVGVSSISPTRESSSMYLKLTHIQVLSQYLRCDGQDHVTWPHHDTRREKGILNKWTVQLWWTLNCSQKAENLTKGLK